MPFSLSTVEFLIENRLMDSREWFKENKERYNKSVLEPFVELVERMTPDMLNIDPQLITEPRVDRTLSRIFRDTRFSKDKMIYRDNMWLVFMRDKKLYEGLPGFYFDLHPKGFSYGMGYYMASSASMAAIRKLVLDNAPAFKKADNAYRKQDLFFMEGDAYKRSRYPDMPEHIRLWLDKKSISFNRHSDDFDLLFRTNLPIRFWRASVCWLRYMNSCGWQKSKRKNRAPMEMNP
jgi:uncharacterized protein (TIGR02453 family)